MKKLFFTLAALVLAGFAANANNERVAFSENEITLDGGQSMELTLSVVDKPYALINGAQYNFTMYDENGNQLNHGCHLEFLQKYGTRDAWAWFGLNMVDPNGTVYNNGTSAVSSNGTWHQTDTWDDEGDYMPDNDYGVEGVNVTYTGKYNVILNNVASNQVFTTRMMYPLQVLKFTVKVDEGWEGNYAELRLVMREYSYSDGVVDRIENQDGIIVLKINNGDHAPVVTPDLPGYIIIGTATPATNGEFYVNYMPGDYEGDYEIVVTINGEVVEPNENGTYQAVEGENNVVVTVKADGYNDKVATNTFNYHYPTTAPAPTFIWNEGTFTMEAVCEGHTVVLYANGTEVANPYMAIPSNVDQTIVFSAMTVAADEDNNSAVVYYAENPVIIPALPVVITPPAAPTYEVTYDDDYMYITFTCEEGELTIYDEYGQEVAENPIVIARPEYDEAADPVYVHFSAKATVSGVDSETVYVNEKVNQKAKPEPQDPHATGWWVVIKNAEGELEWYELHQGEDGSWVTTITLNYGQYGTFYWDPEKTAEENNMNRPNVPYYFVVDGQVWGAPEAEQETLMGAAANTMSNPLYENENFYTVPVGYSYVLGIYVDPSEDDQLQDGTWYYVYCVQGPQTDVNEVNAAKAVAGVRYYNLMGQEMQEANGMTIVVTTYTDGTTSAVKVMK